MKDKPNIYLPAKATIREVRELAPEVNLYTLKCGENLSARPGQFFMVSVFGAGEVPISVASSEKEDLALCIRKVGSVTSAIHALKEGDIVGIRGPYGNGFSLEPAKGRDVVVMAGGLGIVPLRPLMHSLVARKKGKVSLIYGCKLPGDILFRDEAARWEKAGAKVIYTVDSCDKKWKGCVGVVTEQMDKLDADYKKAAAYVCGPEVMIRLSMKALSERGVPDDRIITTLEAHMKCGVGKCGHCYKAKGYVCTDGPVFSLKELKELEARDEMILSE
jgi:NAD(P)H-flavin reductase